MLAYCHASALAATSSRLAVLAHLYGLCGCTMLCFLGPAAVAGASPAAPRYEVGLADGSRQQAKRITAWEPAAPSVKADDRQLLGSVPPLRWIYDTHATVNAPLASWLETWTGDRLPGAVLNYADGRGDAPPQPPHLVMRSITPGRPPYHTSPATVRIDLSSVRRVVWHDEGRHYQPGPVRTLDGRRIDFRAVRWSSDSVTLLTRDGRQKFSLQELAELNYPQQAAWPEFLRELAVLAPDPAAQLVQLETTRGVVVTCSWQRQQVARSQDQQAYWLLGVQPAWSLDVLWLPGAEIAMRRFFQPHEVPLSRLQPAAIRQRSPLAQHGRPWQRDRNVEGGWLESGPGVFGWGFGVHAHNELHFQLPELTTALSGFVGLDSLAGAGGCVQARVLLRTASEQTLFESPVIVGSEQVYAIGRRQVEPATTERTLVLQVDHSHAQRPPGADPLDVRDSADWLAPMLYLDQEALWRQIRTLQPAQMFACRGWQWQTHEQTQLRFQHVWNDRQPSGGHYATAVAVSGPHPLRLVRQCRLPDSEQQLVVTVSCPQQTKPPVYLEVLANGTTLASFEVPIYDRRHLRLAAQAVSLSALQDRDTTPIEFELRQSAGSRDAAVQWHSIEFR